MDMLILPCLLSPTLRYGRGAANGTLATAFRSGAYGIVEIRKQSGHIRRIPVISETSGRPKTTFFVIAVYWPVQSARLRPYRGFERGFCRRRRAVVAVASCWPEEVLY